MGTASERPEVPGYTYCEKCTMLYPNEESILVEMMNKISKSVHPVTKITCPFCDLSYSTTMMLISAIQAEEKIPNSRIEMRR
jgi:hypothetical protein